MFVNNNRLLNGKNNLYSQLVSIISDHFLVYLPVQLSSVHYGIWLFNHSIQIDTNFKSLLVKFLLDLHSTSTLSLPFKRSLKKTVLDSFLSSHDESELQNVLIHIYDDYESYQYNYEMYQFPSSDLSKVHFQPPIKANENDLMVVYMFMIMIMY